MEAAMFRLVVSVIQRLVGAGVLPIRKDLSSFRDLTVFPIRTCDRTLH